MQRAHEQRGATLAGRVGLSAVLALAMVATLTLPATALEPVVGGAKGNTSPAEHCVVSVVETRPDGEMITAAPACYDTYSEAVAFATGGAVQLPASATGAMNNFAGFNQLMAGGALAQHFDGYYGTGRSIIITGSRCGGYWNTWSSWDNRISSTYNICQRTRHYDRPYTSGSSATLTGGLQLLNLPWWMNNRTESIRYYVS